jgi:two-component system, chemotaxis family, protein-glutamate methylesterase/glutaminase
LEILDNTPLRILAADDSIVMRSILWKLFLLHAEHHPSELPRMELCGVASDGVECLEQIRRLCPDALVLDLEMPRLNGLEVLDRLRTECPELPVIMCSAYTEHGARSTLEALAHGASDYVMKPAAQRDSDTATTLLSEQLLPRIAVLVKNSRRRKREEEGIETAEGLRRVGSDAAVERASSSIEIVVIGLSTGGPTALEQLLPKLPKDFPVPVLIVQHMPKLFTSALAERLDQCCELQVKQAYDNAMVRQGTVWLAPGDAHMEVAPRRPMIGDGDSLGARSSRVRLHQHEPLNHCRPSVDYLFFSAARMYGAGALALVMTGMGADGLNGARAVHDSGGVVLAQDEATSAVWGMPGRVSEAGIASLTLPLWNIAETLKQRVAVGRQTKAGARDGGGAASFRREMIHGLL